MQTILSIGGTRTRHSAQVADDDSQLNGIISTAYIRWDERFVRLTIVAEAMNGPDWPQFKAVMDVATPKSVEADSEGRVDG
jgi:hypothetical protein